MGMSREDARRALGIEADVKLNAAQQRLADAQHRARAGHSFAPTTAKPAAPARSSKSKGRPVECGDLRPEDTGERRLQVRVAGALERATLLWCHVPNGEARSAKVGADLKRMGTKRGVPDVLIFTRPPLRPLCCGVALELKNPDRAPAVVPDPPWSRSEFSDDQRHWLDGLEGAGWVSMAGWEYEGVIEGLRALGYDVEA